MFESAMMYVFGLLGVTFWVGVKHAIAARHGELQARIAQHGAACQGRVVAIQRPFMLDSCTRLYVDFLPPGAQAPVRACHIARASAEEAQRPLPVPGATVTVRYLPDQPQCAVIGKLVGW